MLYLKCNKNRKRVKNFMKKINTKGFTLIELLAVITIMGVLMMVAIPSVSRTIENSRRDTFANVAKEYINAVRNAVLADNVQCTVGGETMLASGTPAGTYHIMIDSSQTSTQDLMESGGNSPFGGAKMTGYVSWTKSVTGEGTDSAKTSTTYSVWLADAGKHGLKEAKSEDAVRRSAIFTKDATAPTSGPSGSNVCTLY